jgi:hypothetical protein
MKPEPTTTPLPSLVRRPRRLIARLILAEAIARRGQGPLARPVIHWQAKTGNR